MPVLASERSQFAFLAFVDTLFSVTLLDLFFSTFVYLWEINRKMVTVTF